MSRAVAAFALLLAACSTPKPPPDTVVIEGAALIDGTGAAPVEDSVVVIRDGRILSAGARALVTVPGDHVSFQARGKTLIPGLIDLHVHLGSTGGPGFRPGDYTRERILKNLNSYLYYGVTSVRSAGTERDAGMEIRNEQRSSAVSTARLFTAGRGFTAPGGHPSQEIGDIARQPADEADARRQVAELAAQHVDLIKIWIDDLRGKAPKISRPVIEAILSEAARHRIAVVAHIHSLADARHLLDHGGAGFMHMVRDTEDIPAAFVAQLSARQIVFTPTLIRQELGWFYRDKPRRLEEAVPLVDEDTMKAMRAAAATSAAPTAEARLEFDRAMRNTKRLAEAGVPIGVGSDGGSQMDLPGLMTHRECELLVEAGFTPLEAIVAATRNGALALGRGEELGTIAPGRRADLVLLDADPTEAITNLRRIDRVMLDGRWVDRAKLALR